jgi:hypothetical protein
MGFNSAFKGLILPDDGSRFAASETFYEPNVPQAADSDHNGVIESIL